MFLTYTYICVCIYIYIYIYIYILKKDLFLSTVFLLVNALIYSQSVKTECDYLYG